MSNPAFARLPDEGQSAQRILKQYHDELNTVLCLVFGRDAAATKAVAVAKSIVGQGLFANTRGLHVPSLTVLTDDQKGQWCPQATDLTTVLTFERAVSARLTAQQAVVVANLQRALFAALAAKRP